MKSCVVLSSYNGERYILEQLESIKKQSRNVDAVFIIDDCSTDNTYEIITKYVYSNLLTNWHCEKNTKNIGWKLNFANLIKSVPNEYDVIFLCDQDDVWYKNKVEIMMDFFENYTDTGLLISNAKIVFQDKDANFVKFEKIKSRNKDVLINSFSTHLKRPGCAFAVNRKMAQECFSKFSNPSFSHDGILWLYFYSIDNIKYLNANTFIFRRLGSSSTHIDKKGNRLELKKNESLERIEMLNSIIKNDIINNLALFHLERALKLEQMRQQFFSNKSIVIWLKCLKYINYYPSIKQWVGDLYFTVFI